MKKALLLGSTGLVGSELLSLLLNHDQINEVVIFVRRSTGITHPKLKEHLVDFDKPDEWQHFVRGDVLFSAFGTTIKKAGSQQTQRTIDFTYQYKMAQAASQNKVPVYVLISAPGANPKSSIFYNRIKGELDESVKALPFEKIRILKPSLLIGQRTEKRAGEQLAARLGPMITRLPGLRKFRPIPAKIVAQAMIESLNYDGPKITEFVLSDIFNIAEKSRATLG